MLQAPPPLVALVRPDGRRLLASTRLSRRRQPPLPKSCRPLIPFLPQPLVVLAAAPPHRRRPTPPPLASPIAANQPPLPAPFPSPPRTPGYPCAGDPYQHRRASSSPPACRVHSPSERTPIRSSAVGHLQHRRPAVLSRAPPLDYLLHPATALGSCRSREAASPELLGRAHC
nr:vegetative cell wall protein gp1-like [Lolium perenne]